MRQPYGFFVCLWGLLLLAGCGPGGDEVVPVSGQLTIDGEPLANASLTFAPDAGRPCYGRTDENGQFTMTTKTEGDGCGTGTHQVEVSAVEFPEPTTMVIHTPEKYTNLSTNDLTVTIDSPVDDLKVDLTWDGKKGPIIKNINAE